jgi:hypothetical protein
MKKIVLLRHGEIRNTGLSRIFYTVSMFDVATKERLLFFRPQHPTGIARAIANDPSLQNDPLCKGGTSVHDSSMQDGKSVSSIRYSLTQDEVVDLASKYICNGIKIKYPMKTKAAGTKYSKDTELLIEWRGLNTLIP